MAKTILSYGPSGAFKSSNAAEYIYWASERYDGIVRACYGDNWGLLESAVTDKRVQVWDLTTTADPLAVMVLVGKGWWPIELTPDGKAVPQKNGHDIRMTTPVEWKGIAGYLVEGFQEIGDLFLRMLEAKGRSTGEPLAAEFTETVYGQTTGFAMASRGSYGFVQGQTHRYFKLGLKGLPVPWVMVTTHEYRRSKEGIYGPAVVGKALCDKVPQWFDHVLHFQKGVVDVSVKLADGKTGKQQRVGSVAYFSDHKDPTGILWRAKLGVEPHVMQRIYQRWPGGAIPLLIDEQGVYTSSVATLMGIVDPGTVMQATE